LREATQNGDGEVTSTIFVADAHREFRLALKNSVEVEGGAAKALVSARLECCPPSSSKAANAVNVAATMRVSLEFSTKRGENGINDESRASIILREAYTRQVLNQGECLVLRDFFKSDIAESNATKLTTTKQKAMTSTKDRLQLVCEVDFDSLDSVAYELKSIFCTRLCFLLRGSELRCVALGDVALEKIAQNETFALI
jgi:hypothetical protein